MRISTRIQFACYSYSAHIALMRKQPLQRRSKQLVDALIQATAEVIAERGLDETTTNHVADRAGVSVGSLYQYFENKQQLIEALLTRLSGDIADSVESSLDALMDADVSTVVQGLIETALATTGQKPGLYVELGRNWHRIHTLTMIDALEQRMLEACRRYVLRHPREVTVENLPAALFVVINSTLFTIMRYQSLPHPPISHQELVDALSDMITSYIAPQGTDHR